MNDKPVAKVIKVCKKDPLLGILEQNCDYLIPALPASLGVTEIRPEVDYRPGVAYSDPPPTDIVDCQTARL